LACFFAIINTMRLPNRKPTKFSKSSFDPFITQGKFDELKASLDRLKKRRPKVAEEVSTHAQMGDFSENAEYQVAKQQLRGINSRILILQNQLDKSEIIKSKNSSIVEIGSIVKIKTEKGERTYTIVGSLEADPIKGFISHLSPIGSALLGCGVGDTTLVEKVGNCKVLWIK
jgi:transcription elongation factor GreA